MEEERLFEVRCPGNSWDKTKKEVIKCNKLCLKVFPGSSGECQCRHCKLKFRFYVDNQARTRLAVRAQPIPKLEK